MADTILEKNGKRFRTSDPAKVAAATAKGFRVVPAADASAAPATAAPPSSPTGRHDESIGGDSYPEALQKPLDPNSSVDAFATGAAKFATGGFSDSAAGLGAGAGAAYQTLKDNGTMGEAFDAGKDAFTAGSTDMRKTEDEAWEKSPIAYGGGAATGALGTLPLAGSGKTLPAQAARGAGMGAVGGVGMGGDDDGAMDDIISAYIGASMGGAAPFMGPALSEFGAPAVKAVTGKVKGLADTQLGKTVMQTGSDVVDDVIKRVPGAEALSKFGKRFKANAPAVDTPNTRGVGGGTSPADDFSAAVDDIDAPGEPMQGNGLDVQPFDPNAPKGPAITTMDNPADNFAAEIQAIEPTDVQPNNGLPDWMNQSKAQDWGTRPRADMGGFNGGPAPQPQPSGPLPDPDFLEGIAARNKGGKVTPRTLRQEGAATRADVTIGDSVDRLMRTPESARGAVLEQIVKTKGADYARKVARAAGMNPASVPF